jgi:hypothetical protein
MGEDRQGHNYLTRGAAWIRNCAGDYRRVIEFLQARGLIPASPAAGMLSSLRKLHAATHGLILWRFCIRGLRPHAAVFLDEVASDALQIIPQALGGYRKPTVLLIRSAVENVVRHLFFSDHPVEFERANSARKWYPQVSELFDYLARHPIFEPLEPRFDGVKRLRRVYDDLSAEIHGRTVRHMETRRALAEIRFDQAVFEAQVAHVLRAAEATNFLLLSFHQARVRRLPADMRTILLGPISRKGRRVLAGVA